MELWTRWGRWGSGALDLWQWPWPGGCAEKNEWEPNAEGGCVAICDMDQDKMEPTGAAEVFGDLYAAHFLVRVLEKLGPGRPVNVPDFRSILKRAMDDGADEDFFCEYCKQYGYSCRDCIVTEWKEEIKE